MQLRYKFVDVGAPPNHLVALFDNWSGAAAAFSMCRVQRFSFCLVVDGFFPILKGDGGNNRCPSWSALFHFGSCGIESVSWN